jgi:dethiobiotin synthetase
VTVLIVTGTGTDVGKTVTTAALAAVTPKRVVVVKPAQTGVADGEPGDLAEVTRLSRIKDTVEFARYPDPLSPHHAALMSGRPALNFADVAQRLDDLEAEYDLVLIEGAGGLLVPFASDWPWTLIDLGHHLNAAFVVVTQPGLGTLNHTALTVQHLEDAGLDVAGIVIGSWPQSPDLASELNVYDLRAMSPKMQLGGVLPSGMAAMRDFPKIARTALAPQFGGTFDWSVFRKTLHV